MSLLVQKWVSAAQQAVLGQDPYNPQHGWSTLAQPVLNLDSISYGTCGTRFP